MGFVPNADWGKVCLDFTWNGVGFSICVNFEKASPTPTDFQNLADDTTVNFILDMMPNLTDSCTYDLTTVYDMASDSSPVYTDATGLPDSGGEAGESLPNNTSMCITHRTNLRGRSGRGRTYMGGMGEPGAQDGLFTAAKIALVLPDWENFISGTETDSGWDHVVASTITGGADRTTALLTPTTSFTLTRAVRSQRRRTVEP